MKVDYWSRAGTWIDSSGGELDLLAGGDQTRTFIIGHRRVKYRPDNIREHCAVCNSVVWLHPKDQPVLDAHPGIIVLDPECFEAMETKEI